MSDETPTERFEQPSGMTDDRHGQVVPPDEERKSRTLLILLAVLGGLLLIALVVIFTLVFARGSGDSAGPTGIPTDSMSATPSASPSETPSALPSEAPENESSSAPEATGPRFTSFTAASELRCSAGGPGVEPTRPSITVSWATAGTDEAWYVNGTSDAATARYMQIPLNGDQGDFQYTQVVNCSSDTATFTITLVGPDGTHVNKTTTVALTGDRF